MTFCKLCQEKNSLTMKELTTIEYECSRTGEKRTCLVCKVCDKLPHGMTA